MRGVLAGEGHGGRGDGGAGGEGIVGEEAVGEEADGLGYGFAHALAMEGVGGEGALGQGEEAAGAVDEDGPVDLRDAEASEAEGGSAHELEGGVAGGDEVLDGEAAEDEGEREVLVEGVVELGEDVEAGALGESGEDGDEGSIRGAEAEAPAAGVEVHEAGVAGEAEGFGGEGGGGVEAGDGCIVLVFRETGAEHDAFGLGLAGVVTDVAAGVLAEGGEEGVEGGGEGHAVAGGEGLDGLDAEMGEADVAGVGGEDAEVQGVDAVSDEGGDGALEDGGLVLGTAEDGPAAGEVSGDRVPGADAVEGVLGGEDDADEVGAVKAGHGAGAAGGVGCGQEVQWVEEDVVFDVEMPAECLEFVPACDESIRSGPELTFECFRGGLSRHGTSNLWRIGFNLSFGWPPPDLRDWPTNGIYAAGSRFWGRLLTRANGF